MTVLVVGGADSGKSLYAEKILSYLSGNTPDISGNMPDISGNLSGKAFYIATMEPFGEEARKRIAKHRRQRADRGFITVERFTDLSGLEIPAGCSVLLEDLGNLCANERYSPNGSGENAETAVLRGVEHLRAQCRHLVIVSNEIFCGGAEYPGDTPEYLRLLADVNRRIASVADAVCETVCGIPVYYKGAEIHVEGAEIHVDC